MVEAEKAGCSGFLWDKTPASGFGIRGLLRKGVPAVAAKKDKNTFSTEAALTMSAAEIGKWLDERERKFHREYLTCMNGTAAAIAAGYKPGKKNASAAVQASRLLRCPVGQAYRQAIFRESVEDITLSRESICIKLFEIFQRCMSAVPVMEYDHDLGEYKETGVWQFDAKGATKALGQICTLMGFNAPKKLDVGGDGLEALMRSMTGGRAM